MNFGIYQGSINKNWKLQQKEVWDYLTVCKLYKKFNIPKNSRLRNICWNILKYTFNSFCSIDLAINSTQLVSVREDILMMY